MHLHAEQLADSDPYTTLAFDDEREPVVVEPYVNDEPPRFVSLADLEPVEVTLTLAANPYGGGSFIPADTAAPVAQYRGGSILADDDELREMIAGINRDIRFAELKVKRQTPGASRTRNIVSRQPRTRGRESHARRPGHRRPAGTRAGPSSSDDPPGEHEPAAPRLALASPARRRVVVDERYVVVGMVPA